MKKEARANRRLPHGFHTKKMGSTKVRAKDLQMISKYASRKVFYFLLVFSVVLIVICTMLILELSERLRAERFKMQPRGGHFETILDDFYYVSSD